MAERFGHVEFQATPRPVDRFYPTPDIEVLIPAAVREKLREFQQNLISYCETFREACRAARGADFNEQVARDERWARSDLELSVRKDTGDVDETKGDGHAMMGITHGLTAQASRAMAAMLSRQLLTNHVNPFLILPAGTTQEGPDMVDLLGSMLEDLLSKGKFESKIRGALAQVPYSKVVAFRYRMGAESDMVFDPVSGGWQEAQGMVRPYFEAWPIKQVFISNPDEADPEEQEGVFWLSCVTLRDLQANEAVVGKPGRGGRFVNLEEIQRESDDLSLTVETSGYERASMFPQMGLVEYEGALPFSRFVRDGLFTPELAEIFGVFGPRDSSEAGLIEWGRALERIPVWCISYIAPKALEDFSDVSPSSSVGEHLLQCEPARGMRGRNSLFVLRFHQIGSEFYGQSLPDLCAPTEKSVDHILNAYFRTIKFNSDPPVFFDPTRLRDVNAAEAQAKVRTPGSFIAVKPGLQGADIDKILKYAKLPDIPNAMEMLAYFRALHEAQTGVTAMSKGVQGQTDTGTLGELEIMQSNSTMEVDERILAISQEFSRLFSRIIEDFLFFMQPQDGLISYLQRVSGMEFSTITRILPSLHPVTDSYRIEHPIQAQQDMAVRSSLLMKCMEMFPDVLTDRAEALKTVVEAAGMPRIARRLMQTQRLLTPDDEHRQMRVGNYVKPNPMENVMLHLQQHQREMSLIQSVAGTLDVSTPDGQEMQLELEQLPLHIQDTMEMIQAMMAMQQQAPPDQGGENSEGSQKKVAPEGDRPADTTETETNVRNEAMGLGGENNEEAV